MFLSSSDHIDQTYIKAVTSLWDEMASPLSPSPNPFKVLLSLTGVAISKAVQRTVATDSIVYCRALKFLTTGRPHICELHRVCFIFLFIGRSTNIGYVCACRHSGSYFLEYVVSCSLQLRYRSPCTNIKCGGKSMEQTAVVVGTGPCTLSSADDLGMTLLGNCSKRRPEGAEGGHLFPLRREL